MSAREETAHTMEGKKKKALLLFSLAIYYRIIIIIIIKNTKQLVVFLFLLVLHLLLKIYVTGITYNNFHYSLTRNKTLRNMFLL